MSIADKLTTIAENMQKVYEAGKMAGSGDSYYDEFWDTLQQNGTKKNYVFTFAGNGWNAKTFKPKYDIRPTSCRGLFYYGSCAGMDLTEHLNNLGITLDLSQCTSIQQLFAYGSPKRVPTLDCRGANSIVQLAAAASVETFDKIVLRDDGSQTFNQPFGGGSTSCTQIINLTLEGVIGQNGFNIGGCANLSKASWISIINALSSTTSGLSITGSLASVKKAFETSEGANDGDTSPEWETLENTKTNWTINLI